MAQNALCPGRIYFRGSDWTLLKLFSDFHFLQSNHVSELTGRNVVSVRSRLRQFFHTGYLNRTKGVDSLEIPRFDPESWVYFLDRKGAALCQGRGWEASWTKDKSRLQIEHDLTITRIHIALHKALGDRLTHWEQSRAKLKDHVSIDGETLSIIPDALFTIDHKGAYFLEVVKSRESEYQDGESNIMRKVRSYHHYPAQFKQTWGDGDFRVLFILPTPERTLNLLKKCEDFPYRRFWLTDEKSAENIIGSIFKTPKDYESKSYGFLDI